MDAEVRLITTDSEFRDLADSWSELLDRCIDANVFRSHEWLYSWWSAYKPDAELQIMLVERNDSIVGIAPLQSEYRKVVGIPSRTLRFIGDGTWETDHMGFLIDRDNAKATIRTLMKRIAELDWDIAYFNQMPEGGFCTNALIDYASDRRWSINVDNTPSPVCDLPESYEALLASMPARFRTSLRSSRRKLENKHQVEFGMHDDSETIDEALEILFRNHASRWSAKGQDGVFVDPRKQRFYNLLTPKLLERGWLRFYFLKVDGNIVAQQYCFDKDGIVMLLQEGFDYEWSRKNVGNTLRGYVFEHLIEQHAKAYDFLAGLSRHKKNWSNNIPADLRIQLTRNLVGNLYRYGKQLKERARRGASMLGSVLKRRTD